MLFGDFFVSDFPNIFIRVGQYDVFLGILATSMAVMALWAGGIILSYSGVLIGKEQYKGALYARILASIIIGGGVWSSQFIGLMAYNFSMPIIFNPLATSAWFIVTVFGSYIAIHSALYAKEGLRIVSSSFSWVVLLFVSAVLSVLSLEFNGDVKVLFSLLGQILIVTTPLTVSTILLAILASRQVVRARQYLYAIASVFGSASVTISQFIFLKAAIIIPEASDISILRQSDYGSMVAVSTVVGLTILAVFVVVFWQYGRLIREIFTKSTARYMPLALYIVAGVGVSFIVFATTDYFTDRNNIEKFKADSSILMSSVKRGAYLNMGVIDVVETYFASVDGDVTEKEFNTFVGQQLLDTETITAIGYIEKDVFKGGFFIKYLLPKYTSVLRKGTVITDYETSARGNKACGHLWGQMLTAASINDVASIIINEGDSIRAPRLCMVLPVYENRSKFFTGDVKDIPQISRFIRDNVKGFLVMTLHVPSLIKHAEYTAGVPNIALEVRKDGKAIYRTSNSLLEDAPWGIVKDVTISNNKWQLAFMPAENSYTEGAWGKWMVLLICLFLAAITSFYFYIMLYNEGQDRKTKKSLATEVKEKEELNKSLEQARQQAVQTSLLLDAEQERLRVIMDNVNEGIISINHKGVIYSFNRGAERVFGYSSEDVIGKNIKMLMPEPYSSNHDGYLNRYITTGDRKIVGTGKSVEVTGLRKNGEEFPMSLSISEVDTGEGKMFIGLTIDITAQKMKEEELVLSKDLAEKANKAKDEFLANMSHEIRTPMNGMLGMAELLLGTKLTKEQHFFANNIRRSGDNLLWIINDILDLSKIRAGHLRLEKVPFSLREIVSDIMILFGHMAKERGIELLEDVPKDIPDEFIGDPVRIRQIMTNLVSNAVKFTEKGHVLLRIQMKKNNSKGCNLTIEVEDTGIGIAADKLEYVFDKFAQEEESTTRRFGGTGLGLAICQKLAEMMGGHMDVRSEKNKGTTFGFSVTLKKNENNKEVVNPQVVHEPSEVINGARILVVEDVEMNRILMEKFLGKLDCNISFAVNGVDAVDKIKNNKYDLVFMDCQMPEMDGFDATRNIRAFEEENNLPRMPIVALTADIMSDNRSRCLEVGMDDFLSKPVRKDSIVQVLAHWLDDKEEKQI